MHLWKIQNGIPSLTDNLLVAAVPSLVIISAVECIDPTLEFFESRGMSSYLGFSSLFLLVGTLGGLCLWLFFRNEKRLRPELIAVRRIWAFGLSMALVIVQSLIVSRIFRTDPTHTLIYMAIGCTTIYILMIQWARHRPGSATNAAIVVALSVSVIGLIAKFLSLVLKR